MTLVVSISIDVPARCNRGEMPRLDSEVNQRKSERKVPSGFRKPLSQLVHESITFEGTINVHFKQPV
jgi:hypothetical protein